MYDLVVRLSDLRFHHQVFEHKPVFNLRHSEKSVPCAVLILHRADDLGHVLKLLLIFCFSPLVPAFGKELLVVLRRIVVCVEKILKVVESHDIILLALLGVCAGAENHQ